MARYTIDTDLTKSVKKVLSKYGTLTIDGEKIKGTIKVYGYRKYTWGEQVDIQFTGSIKARLKWGKLEWLDASIMNNKDMKVSKVKVNRFIKRCCLNELKQRLNYFDIRINEYSQITKIKWS